MPSSSCFSEFVVSQKFLVDTPLTLVDVGASGGIDPQWNLFGDHFRAVGFDPLVNECERLNKESDKRSSYVAAFVGAKKGIKFFDGDAFSNKPVNRLSVTLANKLLGVKSNELYNSFQDIIISGDTLTLDDYFCDSERLDFLKIDTDGHDIEVLYGATNLFKKKQFLGICIESQFHGENHPRANTFANIDIFLRANGFTLFDMEFHRYSRSDLPGKFLISIPAQTDIGQIQWADAYYFRDLADKRYKKNWGGNFDEFDIIKLACLFEIHNLHDCAVELLNVHRDRISGIVDVDQAIDMLAPPIDNVPATLQDYRERFHTSIEEMRFLREGDIRRLKEEKKAELKNFRKIILFGAGGRLKAGFPDIVKLFSSMAQIVLCDNDSNKWGKTICTLPIIAPEKINEFCPDMIVIVSIHDNTILKQLLNIRKKNNISYKIYKY